MSWFTTALITGITSFVATNLDDIVILIIFFSQRSETFRIRHIVLGQYLGFTALVFASLPGFFGGLILPKAWIGLLGLLPIGIGLYQLWQAGEDEEAVQTVSFEPNSPAAARPFHPIFASLLATQTYHVAAVTVANGGDNIGIYVPLFASSSVPGLIVILITFLILIAVWCMIAYYFTRHPLIAAMVNRYGQAVVPYVLIGLGIFILIESGTYQLVSTFRF